MTGTAGALDRRFAQISAGFTPSRDALDALAARFQEEIARGLAGAGGSLKMLRTFVEQPSGDERGLPIVVDWGGTHGRVGAVRLEGQGQVRILREDAFTFTEDDKAAPADRVFDVIVAAVDRLVGGDRRTAHELAFVYSFPARLERIDRAIALPMTKG